LNILWKLLFVFAILSRLEQETEIPLSARHHMKVLALEAPVEELAREVVQEL
jgi:hypothetical protein